MQSPTLSHKRALEEEALPMSPDPQESVKKQCTPSLHKVSPYDAGLAMDVYVKFGSPIGIDGEHYPCTVEVKSKPQFALDLSSKETDIPLVVAIMDLSGSMHGERWNNAVAALLYFVSIRQHDLKVCIIVYNDKASVLLEPTLNPSKEFVEDLLNKVHPNNSTLFKPAVEAAMTISASSFAEGRPVIFAFFTDGDDGSTLAHEMRAFKSGIRTETLVRWSEQTRLCVHTIAISQSNTSDILNLMASFGKQKGESLAIECGDIPKVMGALYATIMEVVPDQCFVTVENVGSSPLKTMVLPLDLQIGDPDVINKISFFVHKHQVRVALAVGTQAPFFVFETSSPTADGGDGADLECITSALKFMFPTLVDQTAPQLLAHDFVGARDKVTEAMQYVRAASEVIPVEEIELQLTELRECISEMEINVRENSDAHTVTAFSRIQSRASADFRSLSGAPALIETDGRQMSHSARTYSMAY